VELVIRYPWFWKKWLHNICRNEKPAKKFRFEIRRRRWKTAFALCIAWCYGWELKKAIQTIHDEAGRIDILVNNAGYGLTGAFEDLSLDEIKTQYETNVFGLIRTTQAILPIMQKLRSGLIVNISSGVGRFGYPTSSSFVSTKFAVEGLTESMSYEVEPFGIKVILIEPGVIKTNFFNSYVLAKKPQDPNSPYATLMKVMEDSVDKLMENGSTPQYVAEVVLDAVTSEIPN
jgi:short-subunit dehydrogenase